jgi:hypothetical protein
MAVYRDYAYIAVAGVGEITLSRVQMHFRKEAWPSSVFWKLLVFDFLQKLAAEFLQRSAPGGTQPIETYARRSAI